MDYNLTRAKFYTLFPYYLYYNSFKKHAPLTLSDADMETKIKDHLQSLRNTKEKDVEKWVYAVEESIESRIHIYKLNSFMEVAKQNKYDIPESIKEQIERSIKLGKELKKTLNSKLPIDKLQTRREQLQQCKIITNEMVQFEETVVRCQQWLNKQRKFQETYFEQVNGMLSLKDLDSKIQFRSVQLLANQFNNLPLVYDHFEATTGMLHQSTLKLLQQLPALNKSAKTRMAVNSNTNNCKFSVQSIHQWQRMIAECPVQHQQLVNFEVALNDSFEWIQRISMFLQDERTDKTLKLLNQYYKILNDNPIRNKLQAKLQESLQFYDLIEKIKKEIINPAKYQQTKQFIKRLKEKGGDNMQYLKGDGKLRHCMEWYESQLALNQERLPHSILQLVANQAGLKGQMINEARFRKQLSLARTEMEMPDSVCLENEKRLQIADELNKQIVNIKEQPSSFSLMQLVQLVQQALENSLHFPSFDWAYQQTVESIKLIAQMQFLVQNEQMVPEEDKYFLDSEQVNEIMNFLLDMASRKDFRSKELGDRLLESIDKYPFVRGVTETREFQEYMKRVQAWTDRAFELIEFFKANNSQKGMREMLEQSKSCLISRQLAEQLNRIDLILKWRQKISKKFNDADSSPFTASDHLLFVQFEKDLQELQSVSQTQQKMKQKALDYLWRHSDNINMLLGKIASIQIQNTCKLSQMNKFCKEIDREMDKYHLDDRILRELKDRLQNQLLISDQWKEKYLSIKRFEKKKLNRKDQEMELANNGNLQSIVPVLGVFEGNLSVNGNNGSLNFAAISSRAQLRQMDIEIDFKDDEINENPAIGLPYIPTLLSSDIVQSQLSKKKYFIRNGEFCWYFKFLLMIFEFYNGYKLKFAIEELVRLKTGLTDIYRFIVHYNNVMGKHDKTDFELLNLENQGCKFSVFIREMHVLNKRNRYILAWKELAESIIMSVPVVSMELKARKPEELLELFGSLKNQKTQEQQKINEEKVEELGVKRKRKQNPFYNNEDMTLITEDIFGLKSKKKRKGFNFDTEYRNTSVSNSAKKQVRNQKEDIERTEALLNGQLPAELIQIDDPKQYCICRYGVPNQNSLMIQCEHRCEQWFHIECLFIKKHQTKNDAKTICVGCRALYNLDEPGTTFFWDEHKKISQYALAEIVEEGRLLKVQTQEMKKIESVYKRMLEWKNAVSEILKKVCETNPEELWKLEQTLYELFLQSLWLPTAHPEGEVLKRLLQIMRKEM